mmetsp:Transcript_29784/g.61891  ORF Transcript_29784/g.61891 Transcript_29784/m.61891 type:complete len:498 (+) Transcript_29784:220-1713(+)
MSNQLIVARAKFKFGFVLFIALCLVSMNILLNHPESSSMSSSSLFSTMQQFRLLLSEEEVETPRPRTQHFENDRGIDKKILTPQNSVEQRHLNGGKNSTFVIKYNNRWLHRFRQATRRNNLGGIFFFRHIRKAGGTSLRRYFQQVMEHHNQVFAAAWPYTNGKVETLDELLGKDNPKILYVEEEFHPMSYDCPATDPRWRDTLSVTVLRHPIERHMSEFFYHGPGKALMPLNRTRLYVDEEYTEKISNFLMEEVPRWIRRTDNARSNHYNEEEEESLENFRLPFFSRHYTDNLQLRAFAGCSTRECIEQTSMKNEVTEDEISFIEEKRKIKIDSYSSPNWRCAGDENPIGYCISDHEVCPNGCEGPCKFPSISFGKLTKDDLERAKMSLRGFDIVLITESFDDAKQRAFLADVLSAPREFEIGDDNSYLNHDFDMKEKWKKQHETNVFYRTLLRNLAKDAHRMLNEENRLEYEFYQYAVHLNKMQVEQWKNEVQWAD